MTRPGRFETIAEDAIGAGAGVIYEISENDVYIITNCHVIYDYDSVSYFDIDNDGTRDANETHFAKNIDILIYGFENEENAIPAVIVGGDIANDIAVIKCEKDDFIGEIKEVQIASSTLKVGQSVIAIGNPLAEGIAVTGGLISKVSEQITMIALNAQTSVDTITLTVIRTDTTINSGNSGGGLFNLKGELVGITNAKIVSSGVENMGYAIPVSVVVEVVNGIISG
jgi:serine protease Do